MLQQWEAADGHQHSLQRAHTLSLCMCSDIDMRAIMHISASTKALEGLPASTLLTHASLKIAAVPTLISSWLEPGKEGQLECDGSQATGAQPLEPCFGSTLRVMAARQLWCSA